MRIIFCGTPEFAVPALKGLLSNPAFSVEAVVTQPDRPRGRGHAVSPSPVKEVALGAGVCVYQPEKAKSDAAYDFFKRVAPEAVVIIAFGQIIPAPADRYSTTGLDQFACFTPAKISRRGPDRLGYCQWRKLHRPYNYAD